MYRSAVFSLLLLPAFAVAAPVPKQTPKTFDGFGTAVETNGVTCGMPKAGELRVCVAKDAASEAKTHEIARPLVAQKVEGDFELTVRITHTTPEGNELASGGEGELLAWAGIALSKADGKRGSLVFLNRLSNDRGTWDSYFKLHALYQTPETLGVKGDLSPHHKFTNTPVYLRLTRRGDEFTTSRSPDGKEWSPVFEESHTVPGLGAVSVGPVAGHNTNSQYDVTFDEYVLTPLKKGEKK